VRQLPVTLHGDCTLRSLSCCSLYNAMSKRCNICCTLTVYTTGTASPVQFCTVFLAATVTLSTVHSRRSATVQQHCSIPSAHDDSRDTKAMSESEKERIRIHVTRFLGHNGSAKLSRYSHAGSKGEIRCSFYSFLTSALDGDEWLASRPSLLYHSGKGSRYHVQSCLLGYTAV
jgi:hypothetical protein